jgi:hypothetical protein
MAAFVIRRSLLGLAVLAVLVAACAPTAGPQPSPGPEKVTISAETQGELEAVLRKKADALGRQDLTSFQSTIDLSRGTFRRCWTESFEQAGRGAAPRGASSDRILKIEPYLDTYVRAYVEEPGLGVARRYFRKDSGRWVLTEPRDSELGGEKTKTIDGLDLSYWGIDEDIIDMLGREGIATRSFLLQHARGPTRTPFALRFFPTREAAGLQASCRTLASALINNPRDPYLRFFGVWLAPSLTEVSEDTRDTFRHEGLHWLQDQFIAGISARLDFWLVEGWPDYMGGVDRSSVFRGLVCGGRPVPTFKQLSDGAPREVDSPPELVSQYYAYANTMIEYLYAQFGPDAYWNLMTAYQAGVDPKVNLPQVLKVTPDQFYAGWLEFAKKKYC